MKFKKGDIVEVIEKDFSGGKVYEVGSRWEVVHEDDKNGGYTDDIVYVKDDTRPSETASLYTSCVKKVEGENELKFKKGDTIEVIQPEYSAGKVYEVGSRWEVVREDERNNGKPWDTVYVSDDTRPNKLAVFYKRIIKKVGGGKLMNKQEIKEKLKENGAWCTECHTGEEGRYVEIGKAMELIEQLDEPQKPVVPKFVVPFIEKLKNTGLRYGVELEKAHGSALDEDLADWLWFNKNVLTLFRALDNGYEVEKEPLYYVILSENKGGWKYTYLDEEGSTDFTNIKADIPTFTEKEIKGNDERFWAFAVPVEEVAEG